MKLLKIPQVAEQLNVSVTTVRREIERGHLEAVRIGKVLRVSDEVLADYVDRQSIAALA